MGVYGIQQFGNFLVRQAKEKKDPEELELAKAALTAGVTAPIGFYADKFTAGLSGMGSKKAISEIYAELGKRGAIKEVGKRAGVGAAEGVIAEAPTEVLEQAAERYQAGLDLGGDDAWKEYKEAFFGAAAAGAGISGGAKGIGAYGQYKEAKDLDAALAEVRSEKSAVQEAEEGYAGVDTGIDKRGVPVSDEQGLEERAAGAGEAGLGDLEGNQLSASAIRAREAEINNQLTKLVNDQARIAAFDEADPRINEIDETIKELQTEVEKLKQAKPQNFAVENANNFVKAIQKQNPGLLNTVTELHYQDLTAKQIADKTGTSVDVIRNIRLGLGLPDQGKGATSASGLTTPEDKQQRQVFELARTEFYNRKAAQLQQGKPQGFNAPGQQQGFEFGAADETTQRGIDTEMTETPGFALAAEKGALPTGEVTKVEEKAEEPKAKMMLIGTGANPLAPLKAFLKSLKTATNAPQQVRDYNAEINNLIEDVSEFIGDTTRQVARYREEGAPAPVPPTGPDVSVITPGVQRDQRLNLLDNFFNSLSNVPAGQENLTGTLSQRLAGMNLNDQMQVLGQLTNVPNINTVRGVRNLRAKLDAAMAKFEGEQIGEPVEKAAVYTGDEIQSDAVRRAITILKNIPAKYRTAQERAAMVYFERWGYGMAMRSAAFDLGSKPNELFIGAVFKGQNGKEAALFQEWAKENLPEAEYQKFENTVNEYKELTARAEKLEEDAERVAKGRGVVQRVTKPTGKVSEGFVEGAGMAKFKKPSAMSKLAAQRFYPMHPAMQQAISENNLDAALAILERSGNKFHAGLAKRLRSLGLNTTVVFDRQNSLASQLINANYGVQQDELFNFVKATDEALFNEYFTDTNNFKKVREGLDKVTDKALDGQVAQLKEAYDSALAMVESSGTYVSGLNVITTNFD